MDAPNRTPFSVHHDRSHGHLHLYSPKFWLSLVFTSASLATKAGLGLWWSHQRARYRGGKTVVTSALAQFERLNIGADVKIAAKKCHSSTATSESVLLAIVFLLRLLEEIPHLISCVHRTRRRRQRNRKLRIKRRKRKVKILWKCNRTHRRCQRRLPLERVHEADDQAQKDSTHTTLFHTTSFPTTLPCMHKIIMTAKRIGIGLAAQ